MKIEKNIPIPNNFGKKKSGYGKYPFLQMKIKDSFMVRCKDEDKLHTQRVITTSKIRASKQTGWKFTTRQVKGGIRVWRTK